MPITALPPAPSRADPANFSSKADTWVAALDTFTTEANALQTDVNLKQTQAATSATNAANSAAEAASTANVTKWVSGTSYTEGANVWSPIDFKTYRRKVTGGGTTDPSADATNWSLISGQGDVTLSGTQTLSNKTLNSVILNDGYTEEVFAVSGSTPALSPANGSIQTWTLSANSTPTLGSWNSGQSITLMVDDGSAYTINWASMSIAWKTNGGAAPTLLTSGFTPIVLWKVGTQIYGARVGNA